jgi:hypothetical protein
MAEPTMLLKRVPQIRQTHHDLQVYANFLSYNTSVIGSRLGALSAACDGRPAMARAPRARRMSAGVHLFRKLG